MVVKTPKTKDVVNAGKQVVSFAAGAMASRAATAAIPMQNTTTKRAVVAGLALLGAVAYNGPGKEIVKPLFLGMSTQQTIELVTQTAKNTITVDPNANAIVKLGYGALGLAGCGDCGVAPQYEYAQLASPGIESYEWENLYQDDFSSFQAQPQITGM